MDKRRDKMDVQGKKILNFELKYLFSGLYVYVFFCSEFFLSLSVTNTLRHTHTQALGHNASSCLLSLAPSLQHKDAHFYPHSSSEYQVGQPLKHSGYN